MLKSVARIHPSAAKLALCVAAASFLCGCSPASIRPRAAEPFIIYRLRLSDPRFNVVHVEAFVYGFGGGRLVLIAPEDETGERLEPLNLSAAAAGRRLEVRGREEGWRIKAEGPDFSFAYDVVLTIEDPYADDVRSMLTLLEDDRCRIAGRDVFLVPDAPFASGVLVDADLFAGRGLSSSAPAVRARVIVPGVEELPRTMIACGAFRFLAREIGGTTLSLAIADEWSFDDEEFFDVICRLVAEEIFLLGPPPHERYLFVCDRNPIRSGARFDHYGVHYGGSMLLLLDPRMDRSALMDAPMAVIAHEFFHNWNGETLAGADDGFLWFTEGATVYCSYRILARTGVLSPKQFADHRRSVRARYLGNKHRERVAIGEAGNRDMRDKDLVNLLYDGGYLAAEALDVRIRFETDGASGLIDVIAYLHENSQRADFAGESALVAAVKDLGGGDLTPFLDELIHTSAPRALEKELSPLE